MFFPSEKSVTKLNVDFKIFVDFDPCIRVFYFNFYLPPYKFVLKIPLTPPLNDNFQNNVTNSEDYLTFKYEKFDLAKYVYIMHYE
jgi:hypothetical protein